MEITTEIAVILGALIGGSISILTTWIQQRNQVNRDLTRIAYEMAVKEYETLIANSPGKTVVPLEAFVTYYIEYLKMVKSKKFKLNDITKLREFRTELNKIYQKN
ncbi:hypothetical protein [Psychroserpens ponticola]|uniref:Phage protein n=1 Tax=Psychroserpens ponticola TaxID=2932268 RepID=A0ABY7S2Z2_9FLAO|nr:hypothetical protein [Psychroserpens ponticola]WCO03493.1 hypothetical protein MUN68_008285 [Psychroserpens ponticola]